MRCEDIGAMLDKLLDGELGEDQLRELQAHGQNCPECAAQVRAAMQMKALFGEMDPEVDVPLPAQAAWRGAVRDEARRRRVKRIYAWAGAAAAALVAVVGVGAALRSGDAPLMKREAAPVAQVESASEAEAPEILEDAEEMVVYEAAGAPLVEADGAAEADMAYAAEPAMESEEAAVLAPEPLEDNGASMKDSGAPVHELRLCVGSIDDACAAIDDLVSEYDGTLDAQRVEDGANLYIDLPSDNVSEFIQALAHLEQEGKALELPDITGESTSTIMLVLKEE